MSLVTAKEVARAIQIDRYGPLGTFTAWVLMRMTRMSSINRVYDKYKDLPGPEFLDAILDYYEIDFEIPEEDFRRLPKEGPYITISNHPLGGIDGMLLLKLLLEKRSDYKIIANFLLQRIDPRKPFILPVNPFENRKDAGSSIMGFKRAMAHLQEGHPLGIFPAGEVSTYRDGRLIVDKPWEEAALKLIRKAEVPVVPIYIQEKIHPHAIIEDVKARAKQKAQGAGAMTLDLFSDFNGIEFDQYIIDNLWQVLVGIFGALLIAYCYRHLKRLNIALARIWPSPGLTLIFAGAVILFAYSTLVGHEPLWQAMLGDAYARIIKLAVEEFIELIGYLLWVVGTIEYVYQSKALMEREPKPAAVRRREYRRKHQGPERS